MRQRQCHTWVILVAVALLVAACGQADPSFAPDGASNASPIQIATLAATATPTTSITAIATPEATPDRTPTTGQGQDSGWIDLPAEFTTRTAEQAEALALDTARNTLDASHPHIARTWLLTQREMAQGTDQVLGEHDDPLALIWWVDLDDDDYVIPRCPYLQSAGTPVGCGSSRYASIEIVASNGAQPGLTVGRNFAPATRSGGISLPPAAKLQTEGEAIAATLQYTPGEVSATPQVISVRLLTTQQWTDERNGAIIIPGMAPDLRLWEVELTNANIAVPCMRLDTSGCYPQHADVLFDALNGDFAGVYSPPPASATPSP